MNVLLKICGFALLSALCALLLHAQHHQAGRMVALCAGFMLLTGTLTQMEGVIQALRSFCQSAGLENETVVLIIRLIAMAYITEFAAQACKDAGEEGLSKKCALAGKIILAGQTVPLVTEIGQIALGFLP